MANTFIELLLGVVKGPEVIAGCYPYPGLQPEIRMLWCRRGGGSWRGTLTLEAVAKPQLQFILVRIAPLRFSSGSFCEGMTSEWFQVAMVRGLWNSRSDYQAQ